MKYQNSELLRHLGAEYVLGTLRGPARRRFERLLRHRPEAQEQVDFWEQRLSEFGQIVEPVAPPTAARAALMRHAVAPARHLPRTNALRSVWGWTWPYAASLATAASLVVAFLAGQHNPVSPPAAAPEMAARPAESRTPLPIYAAQLRMPASSMRWLISVSADHRQLNVLAADDFLQAGRHRLQLWCFVPNQPPVPLGVMPYARDVSVSFNIPAALRGHEQLSFAVSLEPGDGSLSSRPRGPVLNEAKALGVI